MVFRSRQPTGEIGLGAPDDDLVLTRILWLEGDEPHNANTRERYIYIHGTNHESQLGEPASHGCVRMRNADIVELIPSDRAGHGGDGSLKRESAVTVKQGKKILAILVAKSRSAISQSLLRRRPAENGGELRENMKTIKFLALMALAAAALSSLNACEAKASTSSSGVSASTTTTSSK